jgi:hypothetical protein
LAARRSNEVVYTARAPGKPASNTCASSPGVGLAGISVGGLIVIIGLILMFVWSFWVGLIIALIGLIAFGGFARGRWY